MPQFNHARFQVRWMLTAAAAVVVSTIAGDGYAQVRGEFKGRPPIDWTAPHQPNTLIVGFSNSLNASARFNAHAAVGAQPLRNFSRIGADVVVVRKGLSLKDAVAAYSAIPGVAYAEPNYEVSINFTPNDPRYPELYGLNNTGQTGGTVDADIDAPEAWDTVVGTGNIIVGIVDTGIDYNHEDLIDNMWINPTEAAGVGGVDDDGNGIVDDIFGARWTSGTGLPTSGDPMDDHVSVFHGTHTAGTVGAVGNNAKGIAGVIHHVQLMGLKFLNSSGSGFTADAIAAIEYAIDKGAHLTSNSWGGGGFSTALYDAIADADAAGQLFIAAAGNSGLDTDAVPHYPSSYDSPNIISVAAIDHNDLRASFSNFGANSVDIAAPGVSILSAMGGNGYQLLSGTSMATPHVSGVAALVLDVHPTWTPADVKNQILGTAVSLPQYAGLWQSCGKLNAMAAVGAVAPPFEPCAGPEPPSHDLCVDAICVTDGTPYIGSTVAATGTDITTCTFNDIYDVWHSYTPAVSGNVVIDTFGAASNYDTALAVFLGCGGTQLACNDDASGLLSQVTVNMTAGVEYLIRVSGYGAQVGTYELAVTGGGGGCTPPPVDTIEVIAPNGGESITRNTATTIEWSSTGSIANVSITLVKGVKSLVLAASTPNDGSFTWNVPGWLGLGGGYAITIADAANPGVSDSSDGTFSLVSGTTRTVTVTAPNGGEILAKGANTTVTWSSTGPVASVHIRLIAGSQGIFLATGVANTGSASVLIPGWLPTASNYQIRITDAGSPGVTDTSDGTFTIQ